MLLDEHYAAEKPLLREVAKHSTRIAAKMTTQHAEILEIGAHLDVARAGGQDSLILPLLRRFHAMARQNIVEEERVMFPLSGKWFQF